MTKKELIDALADYDDNMIIILAASETDDYYPLDEISKGQYIPVESWYGRILAEGEAAEDGEEPPVDAVVLSPI